MVTGETLYPITLNLFRKDMKTIEERAKAASEDYNDDGYSAGLYMGYKVGATEQKIIDINKACEWLNENAQNYYHDASMHDNCWYDDEQMI